MSRRAARSGLVAALAAVVAAALVAPAVAAAHGGGKDRVRVVASGLDNPRGLAFGPDGALYVAESGSGGSDCTFTSPESEEPNCFGTTGAITRVGPYGGQRRVLTGLPSLAAQDGAEAAGPSDISFGRGWPGYFTIGMGGNPALRTEHPQIAGMAKLYRLSRGGHAREVADIGGFEAANNPDAGLPMTEVDTNPNSVYVKSHKRVAVADAGGNDVLSVNVRRDRIKLAAVIPFGTAPAPDIPDFPVPPGTPIPVQSVPTSVVRGPDGALYVGQLTGFPFPEGGASVWRIQRGSAPEMVASGFTQISDLAFGRDGSMYVLEIASGSMLGEPTPGALIRVAPNGTREELAPGTLQQATGLALSKRAAYVSDHGAEAGTGQVVRIPLRGDHHGHH